MKKFMTLVVLIFTVGVSQAFSDEIEDLSKDKTITFYTGDYCPYDMGVGEDLHNIDYVLGIYRAPAYDNSYVFEAQNNKYNGDVLTYKFIFKTGDILKFSYKDYSSDISRIATVQVVSISSNRITFKVLSFTDSQKTND